MSSPHRIFYLQTQTTVLFLGSSPLLGNILPLCPPCPFWCCYQKGLAILVFLSRHSSAGRPSLWATRRIQQLALGMSMAKSRAHCVFFFFFPLFCPFFVSAGYCISSVCGWLAGGAERWLAFGCPACQAASGSPAQLAELCRRPQVHRARWGGK